MKSNDYDERIERTEAQLKKWKSERRALATKEARAAKKEAERKETERLIEQGLEADSVFAWMRNTTVNNGNETITLWKWWEQTQRVQNREHGDLG